MIIGENRVVERGGVLTARGTANSSEDPIGQAHPVVNALIFSEWSDGKARRAGTADSSGQSAT